MGQFDFGSLSIPPEPPRPTDPIELFQSLKVTDPDLRDLYLAQGDALRDWQHKRQESDVSIALNTGAGKTLVGLLVAQSLSNELRREVVYVCGSIQLVEQTAEKAEGYGLRTTSYVRGEFNNSLSNSGKAPCLTTYQAVFNGKSVFRKRDIAAFVFDDAHVAEQHLREQFSVHVTTRDFKDTFNALANLFEDYFKRSNKLSSFSALTNATSDRLLLVHPKEVLRNKAAVHNILMGAQFDSSTETMFAWEHIKDHFDLCAYLFSPNGLTITPPFIPARTLFHFQRGIRRIYLSATLQADDVFARTFGRIPRARVEPMTTVGECERMILLPLKTSNGAMDVELAKSGVRPYKTLVLTPTRRRAKVWEKFAVAPETEEVPQAVSDFKKSTGQDKLLLTGRYDGVDLPGNTCRVMIVDDLPSASGPLDRYLWEYLRMEASLRSTIASRITQSFGRISRGISDHGVVFLTGSKLVDWLEREANMSVLSGFLQRQLNLGFHLSEKMTAEQMKDAPAACLNRDPGWLQSYSQGMEQLASSVVPGRATEAVELGRTEAKFAERLWNREYTEAAVLMREALSKADGFSDNSAGWYRLWTGLAMDLGGEADTASTVWKQASIGNGNIPKLVDGDTFTAAIKSDQVAHMLDQYRSGPSGKPLPLKSLSSDLAFVKSGSSTSQIEEGLRTLGICLGFDASRPDKEYGTGPDVLWLSEAVALCLECKTDKDEGSEYSKKEVGQMSDHIQWVKDNTDAQQIIPCFVGYQAGPTSSANPSPEVMVCGLEPFESLASEVKALYSDAGDSATFASLPAFLQDQVTKRELTWNDVIRKMGMISLVEAADTVG